MMSKFLKRRLALLAIVAVLFGGLAYANRGSIRNLYDSVTGADFQGEGHGSVVLQIAEGDDGRLSLLRLSI